LGFNWVAYWASTKAQTKQKKEGKNILLVPIFWGYFHFGLSVLKVFNLILKFLDNVSI
jgi:hypothetical protein